MSDPTEESAWGPHRAWSVLGDAVTTVVDHVELVRADLPFVAPVGTSLGTHRNRPLVLVHVVAHRFDGTRVDGWGECAALADTTYDREDVDGAVAALEEDFIPALFTAIGREGALVSIHGLADAVAADGHPLAYAALEMAVGDTHLRAARETFAGLLGVAGHSIEPGVVLGLPRSVDQLAVDIELARATGYARVKIKVAPGSEALVDDVVRPLVGSGLIVQLDANGSYGDDAAERLAVLDDLGLACIEQPLDRGDLDGHRRLAAALATPICLDESLESPARVVEAVETDACSVVCVKPARLGGIGAALEVIAWCGSRGVPWWIGGMFESGFARGVNRALAALPGPSLPGDLAPPSSYLVGDLVGPVSGGIDPAAGRLVLPVPAGPGLGPAPDTALLDRWSVRRIVLSGAGA
jgi:O-succinylbenzoate synthase